ncbi:hypothetical protein Q3G72_029389 [Acer saccharum]|nr:hypothetical protein Q3G72_029389 [Acer saccharum]
MSGFGMSKEGASSVRPPLLTGENYSSWKGKMEAYLCQIHDRAWMAVEDGYAPPKMTPTEGGEEVLKPKAQFKKLAKFESKDVGSRGQDLKKKGTFNKFEPRQEKTEIKDIQCYECGGVGHFTSDCANRLEKKKGKVMAASLSGSSDDSGEGDESSSDKELATNYTAFGATCVEDEVDGNDALTVDPIEEIDEEVALEVIGVATH